MAIYAKKPKGFRFSTQNKTRPRAEETKRGYRRGLNDGYKAQEKKRMENRAVVSPTPGIMMDIMLAGVGLSASCSQQQQQQKQRSNSNTKRGNETLGCGADGRHRPGTPAAQTTRPPPRLSTLSV